MELANTLSDTAQHDTPRLLTLEDVALRLNVSTGYVKQLIRNGSLPVIWFGYRVKRVDEKAVDQLILERTFRNGKVPGKRVALQNLEVARRALRNRRALKETGGVTTITGLEAAEQTLEPVALPLSDELEL